MGSLPRPALQPGGREMATEVREIGLLHDQKELGTRLHLLRYRRGWSMSDIETMTGVPASTLSRIERGRAWPRVDQLIALCEATRWTRTSFSPIRTRGCGSMVERKLPKLETGVRFPSPAPVPSPQVVASAFRRVDARSTCPPRTLESHVRPVRPRTRRTRRSAGCATRPSR